MGPPKTGGSWWRGLTECGPLEKGMANHFSILALRTPWSVWKGKMIAYWKRNSPGREWTLGVGDGQGGLACCNSWGHKESDTTEWLNWTKLKELLYDVYPIISTGILSCCCYIHYHQCCFPYYCCYFDYDHLSGNVLSVLCAMFNLIFTIKEYS